MFSNTDLSFDLTVFDSLQPGRAASLQLGNLCNVNVLGFCWCRNKQQTISGLKQVYFLSVL